MARGRKPPTYDRSGKAKRKKGHIGKGLPIAGKVSSPRRGKVSLSPEVTVTVKGSRDITPGRPGAKKPGNMRPDATVKVTVGRGHPHRLGNACYSMRGRRWNSSEAVDGDYPGGYSGGPAIIRPGSGRNKGKGKGKNIPGVVVYPGRGKPDAKKVVVAEVLSATNSSNNNTPPASNPQSEKVQYSFLPQDINDLLHSSEEFVNIMATGNYVYVQKRIVLKHPACIDFRASSMSAVLTDRVKSDPELYCLGMIRHKDGTIEFSHPEKRKKFTRNNLGSTLWDSHIGDQISRFFSNNGSDLPPIFPFDFDEGENKPDYGGGGGFPPDPPINWLEIILKTYMKLRKMSEKEVGDQFGASDVTIRRMWSSPDSHTAFRNAIGVCLALRIQSGTSEIVIHLCGYYLRDTKQEHYVKALIHSINDKTTIDGCNQFLIEHDCLPIQEMK